MIQPSLQHPRGFCFRSVFLIAILYADIFVLSTVSRHARRAASHRLLARRDGNERTIIFEPLDYYAR